MFKTVVANWKDHPATEEEAVALALASDFENAVVCPPHRFLDAAGSVLHQARLGAQDYGPDDKDRRVAYVIVGHSDRRKEGETNDIIAEKVALAAADGLIPILCVGETHEQRARGQKEEVIREQVRVGLSKMQDLGFKIQELLIAYEPVWAISTESGTRPEKPEDAVASIAFIKEQLLHFFNPDSRFKIPDVRFLYGGSVSSENVQIFISQNDIDGVLVGAASLNPEEIKQIWQITQTATAKK